MGIVEKPTFLVSSKMLLEYKRYDMDGILYWFISMCSSFCITVGQASGSLTTLTEM